jgi:hypothetical protein
MFPRLYSLSTQKESMVFDLLVFDGNQISWSFLWRRNLFEWERDLVVLLENHLEAVVLSLEVDRWCWLPDSEGLFSVKSSYNLLWDLIRNDDAVLVEGVDVIAQLWDSAAPSKVIAFSWQLLYDRIPSRSNLAIRGILGSEVPWSV